MNIYQILLKLTRMHADPATLERVLEPLGTAVRECSDAIASAQQSGIEDYIDAVVDDECAVVEALLGSAFVTTQAVINGVVAHIVRLHERVKADGYLLKTTDGKKASIQAFGSPTVWLIAISSG